MTDHRLIAHNFPCSDGIYFNIRSKICCNFSILIQVGSFFLDQVCRFGLLSLVCFTFVRNGMVCSKTKFCEKLPTRIKNSNWKKTFIISRATTVSLCLTTMFCGTAIKWPIAVVTTVTGWIVLYWITSYFAKTTKWKTDDLVSRIVWPLIKYFLWKDTLQAILVDLSGVPSTATDRSCNSSVSYLAQRIIQMKFSMHEVRTKKLTTNFGKKPNSTQPHKSPRRMYSKIVPSY